MHHGSHLFGYLLVTAFPLQCHPKKEKFHSPTLSLCAFSSVWHVVSITKYLLNEHMNNVPLLLILKILAIKFPTMCWAPKWETVTRKARLFERSAGEPEISSSQWKTYCHEGKQIEVKL